MIYHERVPRELKANLLYRQKLLTRAAGDIGFQQAMISACGQDVLFFMGAFGWLYEPRPRKVNGKELPNKLPFIPWPHQESAIKTIREALGYSDVLIEKSRAEGGSWVGIYMACQDFLFKPLSAIGFVSRNLEAVDSPEDSDSLFWKVAFVFKNLPKWMLPKNGINRKIAEHTFRNNDNESMISGYAAVGDVGTGGRKRWFLLDELSKFPRGPDAEAMSSTQHVTNSRLIVSTPKGAEGEYHRLATEPSNIIRVVLDWKMNPTRNRGLYELKGSTPVAVDPINNPLPPEYNPPSKAVLEMFSQLRRKGFKLEGKQRSPWYDNECSRGATPQSIAQELDRDFGGSSHRIFMHDFMAAAEKKIEPARSRYTLDYNEETLELDLQKDEGGLVHLWTELDADGNPPKRQYVLAADISAGLGGSYTSNSVAQVIDLVTGEQILEYAVNVIEPGDFADECVALAKWLGNCLLIWEANGVGGGFTARVKKRGYANIYYRTQYTRKGRKKSKEMGWHTSETTKELMFTELNKAVRSQELIVHSKSLVDEFGHFVRIQGKITHALARNTTDDSSKGAAHGDRVMAMAMAVMGMRDRPLPVVEKRAETELLNNPPPNSLAARDKEYLANLEKENSEWDDRDNRDLAQSSRGPGLGGFHFSSFDRDE